ncbi:MAG: hypothetical protein LBJ70_03370 [Holosporales bacterium]|jgi:hypothetical protein|nr:hypothetical protein [Holosporales bacterium]
MRRSVLLLLSLGILCGLVLCYSKYRVVEIEENVRALLRAIDKEEEQHHVLKAEWKYATDAQRVQKLAQKHLGFAPLMPKQLMPKEDFLRVAPVRDALGSLIEAEEEVLKAPQRKEP